MREDTDRKVKIRICAGFSVKYDANRGFKQNDGMA
jgi:hypothetical protein